MIKNKDEMTLERAWEVIEAIRKESKKWLFGLNNVSDQIILAMFTLVPFTDRFNNQKGLRQGSILFVGATGVGKTDLVNTHAMVVDADFKRIQGTTDLLPSDILGQDYMITGENGERRLLFSPGPIFAHMLLIDEGNRMKPQTKSALIEAMEEQCVTAITYQMDPNLQDINQARSTRVFPLYPLSRDLNDLMGERFFLVFTTQNFIEFEGTYPSPEAELDRYTMRIIVPYPQRIEDEMKIDIDNVVGEKIQKVTDLKEVLRIAHFIVDNVEMNKSVNEYATRLIRNSRVDNTIPALKNFLRKYIKAGVSPRTNYHLKSLSRVIAFFDKSKQVLPDHVKRAAPLVLAHRLVLNEEVLAIDEPKEFIQERIIEEIIKHTEVPPWSKE